MDKNYSKYLTITELEKQWGFYVLTAGHSRIDTNQVYPDNRIHPDDHSFTWNKGRMLHGYYLVFITQGEGIFDSELTGTRNISAGTCFLLFPGVWHRYKPNTRSGWEEYWVGFKGSYPDDMMNRFFTPEQPFIRTGPNEMLLGLFQKLIQIIQAAPAGYHQIISGITLQILGLVQAVASHEKLSFDPTEQLINKAKFLLQESLESWVNVEQLAQQLPMGYSRFRKAFKAITGQSPNQYHLNLKLNKAKDLLLSTALSVNEIAYQTGFESAFYFSRAFRKKNGVSPKVFRQKAEH
ncbi:AraC family transcriptional regulator [Pedobacter sp. BS3]|uniref:helix-turn-helix domain-containing protein n=1 Tax=Pedobacter sp. BS3 TaxID=2567937 RepID=UPI0011EEE7C9|nr:AraC family transcriptional regulator [Pedobacter sp. BS3]TZF84897.1 AraC family transcriptional regulator [Pedobacter sp. BS3]